MIYIDLMASFSELLVPLIPAIFFLIFLYNRKYNTASKTGKTPPPSPGKLPIIGNLHQFGTTPHRFLQTLSYKYGPLFMLHFGSVPAVVTSSVEGAREIMKNQDLIFATRPKISVARKLLYGPKDVAFAPYGDYWRQMRSICVLHLLSNKRVKSFGNVRAQETSLMLERIRESGSAAMNLSHTFTSLTNGIISRVVMGRKSEQFMQFVRNATETVGSPNIADYIPRLAWINKLNGFDAKVDTLCKNFDQFLESVLKERRDQEKQGRVHDENTSDFVDILLDFQRENKFTSPIEDDAIKALLIDMFVGGTDTSQSVLEWTASELLRHPKILAKLQNEIRQVAGTKQDIVTEDDIEKMPYLNAVIKESMRLHSPVPLLAPREALTDTKLLGYDVAAGTQVYINAWAISRDPSVWKNPEEFVPERFFETNIDFKGHHFELIPFGAGRRGCPGIAFAIAVDELGLANLLHKFDIMLPSGVKKEDLDMREAIGMTVHKKTPLFVVAKPAATTI